MNRPKKLKNPQTAIFKIDISADVEKKFKHLCVEISSDCKKKTGLVKSRQTIIGGIIEDWVDKHTQV